MLGSSQAPKPPIHQSTISAHNSSQGASVSESSRKVAGAELIWAGVDGVGLLVTGGTRVVGWLVRRTKARDQQAQHRDDVMERFDRFERWCARVDSFMATYTEHRIADVRFMARTHTALTSLPHRGTRVGRVQANAGCGITLSQGRIYETMARFARPGSGR